MRRVEPKVFMIGETQVNLSSFVSYLRHIGVNAAGEWPGSEELSSLSSAELLSEFYGRLCYKSFKENLNPNVTKVRKGNEVYLKHILDVKHLSVLEHCQMNWVVADLSRVATHEIVRHRVGIAFSQESLRYVRLTDLGLWLPAEAEADPNLVKMFEEKFAADEAWQKKISDYLEMDNGKDFEYKKRMTSLMRRGAPIGLATTIGMSMNHRQLRHMITLRTSAAAEAEVRLIFGKMIEICKIKYPNIYQDIEKNEKGEWVVNG